jgi:hypothetical protein
VLDWALGHHLVVAVHVSAKLLGAHPRKVARIAALDLLHIEALELSAQLYCPDRRARLTSLVGFIPQLTQHLHVGIDG